MANPLDRAARYLLAAVRRGAPTEKSAASFRLTSSGSDYLISSDDTGTIATELAWRHPLFGDKNAWYGPAGKQRGRRHFIERSAEKAGQVAAQEYCDEFVKQIIHTTEFSGD